jgi:hypothetical protein
MKKSLIFGILVIIILALIANCFLNLSISSKKVTPSQVVKGILVYPEWEKYSHVLIEVPNGEISISLNKECSQYAVFISKYQNESPYGNVSFKLTDDTKLIYNSFFSWGTDPSIKTKESILICQNEDILTIDFASNHVEIKKNKDGYVYCESKVHVIKRSFNFVKGNFEFPWEISKKDSINIRILY